MPQPNANDGKVEPVGTSLVTENREKHDGAPRGNGRARHFALAFGGLA